MPTTTAKMQREPRRSPGWRTRSERYGDLVALKASGIDLDVEAEHKAVIDLDDVRYVARLRELAGG